MSYRVYTCNVFQQEVSNYCIIKELRANKLKDLFINQDNSKVVCDTEYLGKMLRIVF